MEIADHAHNSRGALGDGVEFLRGLDETERQCEFSLYFYPSSSSSFSSLFLSVPCRYILYFSLKCCLGFLPR